MIYLKDILYRVSLEAVVGNTNVIVNEIHFDSRKVSFNDVFVAVRGTQTDGHAYIEKAVEQGALAVVCEEMPKKTVNGITYVKVKNPQQALAFMAGANSLFSGEKLLTTPNAGEGKDRQLFQKLGLVAEKAKPTVQELSVDAMAV